MFAFITPWKNSENQKFSGVFRGYKWEHWPDIRNQLFEFLTIYQLKQADKLFECVWPFCRVGAERVDQKLHFLCIDSTKSFDLRDTWGRCSQMLHENVVLVNFAKFARLPADDYIWRWHMLNVAANILRKGDIKLRKGKYHNSKSICKSFLVLKKSKKTE